MPARLACLPLAAGLACLLGVLPVSAQSAGPALSPVAAGGAGVIPADQAGAYLAGARPMQALADAAALAGPRLPAPDTGPMQATRTDPGRPVRAMVDEADYRAPAAPSEVSASGSALDGTPYQFTESRLFPGPVYAPWRSVGRLVFTAADGQDYWCSAALIGRAILLTAGHCVHQGGTGADSGFNRQGYFYPGYSAGDGDLPRFGRCRVVQWATTHGWYDAGALNRGEDIGLALCDRIEGARWTYVNNWLPGERLGYLGFCHGNCRPAYQMLTQAGYADTLLAGGEMGLGQHLGVAGVAIPGQDGAVGGDLIHGSALGGGSDGAPHLRIEGGEATVVAVTSWSVAGEGVRIHGAAPLSGIGNRTDFEGLYNALCASSRHVHGAWSCRPLR